MTALVTSYTPEGFVVGADGMRRNQDSGQVETLKAQKIFPIQQEFFVGAYGWAGMTRIFYSNKEPFDFAAKTNQVIRDYPCERGEGFSEYTERITDEVFELLFVHNNNCAIPADQIRPDEINRVLFVGYVSREAWLAQIVFPRFNGHPWRPHTDRLDKEPQTFAIVSGSEVIWNKYPCKEPPDSLTAGATLVRGYIQSCADHQGEYVECKNIGGRIHIASVTEQGFKWIEPPLIQ